MSKKSVISYMLIILLGEKVIQYIIVSLSFFYNIGDIRSTVAVDYRALMISGAIISVLFVVTLWGVIRKTHWGLFLVAFLAISDIVGEFIAQGTISPPINISILVSIVLLLLCYPEYRTLQKTTKPEVKKIVYLQSLLGERRRMKQSIMKYKVVLFYSFTFAISWAFWFLMFSFYRHACMLSFFWSFARALSTTLYLSTGNVKLYVY